MKKYYAYVAVAVLLNFTALPATGQAPAAPAAATAIALATAPEAAGLAAAATPISTHDSYAQAGEGLRKKRRKKSGKTVWIVVGVAAALTLLRILL